jgi:hypothetical protein
MNRNFPTNELRPLRPVAAWLTRALSYAALAVAAPLVGLAFIVLLPLIGLVVLLAAAVTGAIAASINAWRNSTPASDPRSMHFALRP